MKKMIVTLIAVFGLVGGVYGFIQHRAQSKQQQTNQQTKLRVVTTNSILEDMVTPFVATLIFEADILIEHAHIERRLFHKVLLDPGNPFQFNGGGPIGRF